MARVELENGRINIYSDPFREKLLVRAVPGRKWDAKQNLWHVPLSWASCCALRGVFKDDLEIGLELGAWARDDVLRRVQPVSELREMLSLDERWTATNLAHLSPFDTAALEGLYPFQQVGALFMSLAQHALLADEMGTGKTIQTIAALKGLDAQRTLIVCPNSVKRNWLRELLKWWPEAYAEVYTPGKAGKQAVEAAKDGSARVLIVNWENTWRLSKLAPFGSIKMMDKDKVPKALNEIPWDAVVADEAHRAKEPSAKQTRALWALMHAARHRFALTGTPLANSPRDLWSIMHGLAPDDFPAYSQFIDRYGLQSWNAFGGLEIVGLNPATRAEFFKFFDPRFLRRSKELVLPHLPKKVYVQRYCSMPAKQKKAYKELEKMMLTELDSGDVAYVTSPLAKLVRLRQVAAAYVDVDGKNWQLTEPSAKLDQLDEVIEEAGDEQVVVFAEHRQLIELYEKRLEKRGVEWGALHGGVAEADRAEAIERFKAGKLRIMLCTLGAGGEGVDGLQVASTVVFLQRAYSMVKDKQAEDRLHRQGQEADKVEVIDIITEDTIEDRIFEVLGEKSERLEEICRDQDTLRRLLGG